MNPGTRASSDARADAGSRRTWRRAIVKVGTNLLTGGSDSLDDRVLADLARQIAVLKGRKVEVLLVTSGAVAAGRDTLGARGIRPEKRGVAYRQVLAAVGQSRLMGAYERHFDAHGIAVAQALLSRNDLESRLGYLNIRNTLERLLALGVVPIVNENDVVAVEELENEVFGDNDRLSAMVANAIDADVLVLLGEVEGLFSGDPNLDPGASLIPEVEKIDGGIERIAGPAVGGRSRGGMASKVEAARIACAFGATVIIASGRAPDVLLRLNDSERIGTRFSPAATPRESRKRWILTGVSSSRGGVVIDAGAVRALTQNGHSLLPAGIVGVQGAFQRGDIISIRATDESVLAWGITNYSSTDAQLLKGHRSEDRMAIVASDYGPEVVHRNNMALA
ncbi:MAG: glutamate 5-kinase [SAR202 cluster bacterium]|nr:glutamate 5-kinase [SAR202 cluster bacterium]